jgi:hypothetical protein
LAGFLLTEVISANGEYHCRYGMEPGTKCYFYMDNLFGKTFYCKQRANSSASDGEYHDPRDNDEVIVHYPPVEPEAEEAHLGVEYVV